jgi:Carboxypeptidase regulatory-like domain
MISGGYNANVQIFQTREYVALLNEQIHNARIVPLDGRHHGTLRQWAGDSRGRWEGQTLVIDSTNFTPFGTGGLTLHGPSRVTVDENLRLTERFTRVSADTLLYEATIDDPTIWTKPWTISAPMTTTQGQIYEYACHEGNYGMANLLSGARAADLGGGDEQYCYSFDRDCDEVRKLDPTFKNVNHDVTGSGSITGEVRDTTGAALAGVTVQAESPSLFEKVRTVVTDDQGQYKFPNLRVGTYTVTFSLAGFKTIKHEGLEVAAPRVNPTANAELPVANR